MRRLGAMLALGAAALWAQLDTRANDPLGRSIRTPRIQVIHSHAPDVPGTSAHLQQTDPWLAYEMGWYLFARQWSVKDGLFGVAQEHPMAAAANSCAACHNLPFHTAGAGGNFSDTGGNGRKTRHLFGIGLIETIGIQVRRQILAQFDTNRNGFLDYPSETRGKRAVVEAVSGLTVDFGALDDLDGDGLPDLNDVVQPFLVDSKGRPALAAPGGRPARLGDPGVAGYDVAVSLLSSSSGDHQLPSLRLFSVGVMQTVFGLPVGDEVISPPLSLAERGVWAGVSNTGAPQLHFTLGQARGRGCQYVSAGDLDLLEWFLLNHPAPAMGKQYARTRRGERLMRTFGCTSCHVQDWRILPADESTGMPGDRRFFNLAAQYDDRSGGLGGSLQNLTRRVSGEDGADRLVQRRQGFDVRGIYTDFRYHDIGVRFYDYAAGGDDGVLMTRRFRTPPLWGAGSTAPYGHDGRSATLDDVIRRHGGEAQQSRDSYVQARPGEREALVAFLESLILYDPATLPTDINGDGRIDTNYMLAGSPAGPERLRPELLFRTPPRYRGWVNAPEGGRYFSLELTNQEEVFGTRHAALRDSNRDGIPDLSVCRPDATNSEVNPQRPEPGRPRGYQAR